MCPSQRMWYEDGISSVDNKHVSCFLASTTLHIEGGVTFRWCGSSLGKWGRVDLRRNDYEFHCCLICPLGDDGGGGGTHGRGRAEGYTAHYYGIPDVHVSNCTTRTAASCCTYSCHMRIGSPRPPRARRVKTAYVASSFHRPDLMIRSLCIFERPQSSFSCARKGVGIPGGISHEFYSSTLPSSNCMM